MKKAELEKLKGAGINSRLAATATPGRFGKDAQAALSRREQRRRDQARGLVPFACKLEGELVKRLQDLAAERRVELGEVVTELLRQSLKD